MTDVCGKKCDHGSECLLVHHTDSLIRHETQHGCIFYDTHCPLCERVYYHGVDACTDPGGESCTAAVFAAKFKRLEQENADLKTKIEAYRERLECNHVFRLENGEYVRVAVEDGYAPDGITCRDLTISMLKSELAEQEAINHELRRALSESQ